LLQEVYADMEVMVKNAWKLVKQPEIHERVYECKWIFRKKKCILSVEKIMHVARLVTKGFTHIDRFDLTTLRCSQPWRSIIG